MSKKDWSIIGLLILVALLAPAGCVTDRAGVAEARLGGDGEDAWESMALHFAAAGGHVGMVEHLISQGADVNAKADPGWRPLHYAAAGAPAQTAGVLIENGADVNAKDKLMGWSPLHYAAASGHKAMAQMLVSKGADANLKNDKGQRPADIAVERGHPQTAKFLREHSGS
ncbi:MAG: ankyrin repeat domain-containing protein [Planctomycetota bacterium]|jgi:cytohesin